MDTNLLNKIKNSSEIDEFITNHYDWNESEFETLKEQLSLKFGEIEDYLLKAILKKAKEQQKEIGNAIDKKDLIKDVINSNELSEFITNHPNGWNHSDWLMLKNTIVSEYGEIEDYELGAILEKVKNKHITEISKPKIKSENSQNSEQKKKCHYCKELIKEDAYVCPYCQSTQKTWEEKDKFVRQSVFKENSDSFGCLGWIIGIVGLFAIAGAFEVATWFGIVVIIIIGGGIWIGYNYYIDKQKENYYDNNSDEQIIDKMIAAEREDKKMQEIEKRKRPWKILKNVAIIIVLIIVGIYYFKPFEVNYEFNKLNTIRTSWDEISIETEYKKKTIFSEDIVYPNTESIVIKDNNYNLLYEGTNLRNIDIPDKDLGSEERINIEIIAYFDDNQVKKSDYITTSTKKFTMHSSISYPKGDFATGSYDLSFDVKRNSFDNNEIEEVLYSDITLPVNIKIFISDNETKNISLDLSDGDGSFDISDYSNYNSFRSSLLSELESNSFVDVKFDVTADYHGSKIFYAPIVKTIKEKSDYEKSQEANYFGKEAGNKIMEGISPNTGNTLSVYIEDDDIEYDLYSMKYTIPMKITWWGATWIFGDEHKMIIEGILTVNEDGSNPQFERTWINDYAQDAIDVYDALKIGVGTIIILDELDKQGAFD